ncbi:MAG: hypothetical protein G8D66_00550 [gamma proteobacterium symbiont of Ctena orbiculata]
MTGLSNLTDELENVAKACKMIGDTRDTFYLHKGAVQHTSIELVAT